MPSEHTLQSSRYELKYLIDETCARAVREYALAYLVPDVHAASRPNCEYPVHSLYLDSADLSLCQATLRGLCNRFKLRVRFYGQEPGQAGYFEIKRRLNDVICKQRCAVRPEAVAPLLAGHLPSPADVHLRDSGNFGSLESFCRLQQRIGAEPRVFVSYMREAYVTPENNSVRVTFDRRLRTECYRGQLDLRGCDAWLAVPTEGVVLEIKFTDRFPNWIRQMVHAFSLQRRSMAKYVCCAQALRRRGVPLGSTELPGAVEARA